jgi:exonuclease V gamma subunit
LLASGDLPLGRAGTCRYEQLRRTAERIAELARRARAGATLPPLRVELELPGARLVGNLRDRCAAGLVIPRFSRLTAKYQIEGWIRHLVLSAVRPTDSDARTVVIGRGDEDAVQACAFAATDDAAARLTDLVALFRLGQCQPLPLFPRASLAWSEKIGKGAEAAHRAAQRAFGDGEFAERDHPAIARVWGSRDPTAPGFRLLDDAPEFAEIAARVVVPLVAARRDP